MCGSVVMGLVLVICWMCVVILVFVGVMICEFWLVLLRYILYLLLFGGLCEVVIMMFVFVLRWCMVNVRIGVGSSWGSRIVCRFVLVNSLVELVVNIWELW